MIKPIGQQEYNDTAQTKSVPGPLPLPLQPAKKRPAPIVILSPAKRSALIECFDNNGLQKVNGAWRGAAIGKLVSGITVADLRREDMLTLITDRKSAFAQLTKRGHWFAQTLREAADAGQGQQ